MKLPLNNILKKSLRHLAFTLKEKANLIFVALLLIDCLGAALIVYLYIIRTPQLPSVSQNVEIKTQMYQDVMNRLNARETKIQEGIAKSYPDIFR